MNDDTRDYAAMLAIETLKERQWRCYGICFTPAQMVEEYGDNLRQMIELENGEPLA